MLDFGFYNIDCMEGMKEFPDKYFDLAIVDPPYGIDAGNNTFSDLHDKKDWDVAPPKSYFDLLFRISKNQIVWGANYFHRVFSFSGRIVWDKDLTPKYEDKRSEYEIAFCSLHERVAKFRYRWIGNVQGAKINWSNSGEDKRIHPTQKPIALYRWLLQNYAKQGDKILDTHVGSASSLIAFEKESFDYVGFELDEDYFRDAIKRLKQSRITTIDMFKEPKIEGLKQENLF